jgi:hypothetical protein
MRKAHAASFRHVEALAHFIGRPRSKGRTAYSGQSNSFLRECNSQMRNFEHFVMTFARWGVPPACTREPGRVRRLGDPEEPYPRGPGTAGR